MTTDTPTADTPTVVFVHGAWADATGFGESIRALRDRGFDAIGFANPLRLLTGDAGYLADLLRSISGPIVLVGHSYGGAVITEAGDDPSVVGLVYVAAFAPDVGESVFGLLAGGPQPPIEVSADGFAFFNRDAFVVAFASGLDPVLAAFLADVQVPISVEHAGAMPLTVAAWHDKPSWYVVAGDDHIIPPDAQRQMAARAGATVTEHPGAGHIGFVVDPAIAAAAIMAAARTAAP
jgi:pimeloyl-ACP methyl ester carboxylesterase